jgi:signal transduction histidine kinase
MVALNVAGSVPLRRSVARASARRLIATPRHLSLSGQFVVASFVVLVIGMLVIGTWVGSAIERGVLNRSAAVTALYVDSVLADYLEGLAKPQATLTTNDITNFDHLISDTPLGQKVVAFKIWSSAGEVLYSPDRRLMGRHFEVDGGLQSALEGNVSAELSDLSEDENAYERERWSSLLEVYAPVRTQDAAGNIVAVVEFYQTPDELEEEIAAARRESWGVVAAVMLGVFLLLAGIVKRGSDTIVRQQRRLFDHEVTLRQRVSELSELLEQNARLHDRVRTAANRTTTLNEQALRRIGADLHDGPGQALGLALLRLDLMRKRRPQDEQEFSVVQGAVRDALGELRAISSGLRLPSLAALDVREVAERAVRTHERRSGTEVELVMDNLPAQAPLSVKITLFRTLEEALSNATRHGQGLGVVARIYGDNGGLQLSVSDQGPGFAPEDVPADGHLGLANMRERAELLGGSFHVTSARGQGTTLALWMPLPLSGARDRS